MTTINSPSPKLQPAWLLRAHGLIGVDVGSCGLKLAQLQQTSAGWRFQARCHVPFEDYNLLTRESLLQNGFSPQLPQLTQASQLFVGRQAACALPTSLLALRSFELPPGPIDETRLMVEQELAEDPEVNPAGYEFATWIGVPGNKTDRVIAVSADHDVSLKLAKELLKSRLRTTMLDVAPCALARAAALVDAANDEPVAVLDLGFATSLFTVVRGGRPLYCRTFRNCGLQVLLHSIEQRLNLCTAECRQLLRRYGISFSNADGAAKSIGLACEGVLNSLADELLRTLQYFQSQARLTPQKLWVSGHAATIPHFTNILEEALQLPTYAWQLPGSGDPCDAHYATAAGLSAIAWEVQPCM